MNRRPNCRGNEGFTLLEMLLVLALAAILLTLLIGGFQTISRHWARENGRLAEVMDDSLALLQIERALEGAWPHVYLNKMIFFEGRQQEMAWVSTVSPSRREGIFAWRVRGDQGGGFRISGVDAYPDDPSSRLEKMEKEDGKSPPVFFPEHQLNLEYLAPPARMGEEREWLPAWSGKERLSLPLAVRLKLIPKPGSNAAPYEAIAPIAAHEHQTIKAKLP